MYCSVIARTLAIKGITTFGNFARKKHKYMHTHEPPRKWQLKTCVSHKLSFIKQDHMYHLLDFFFLN